MLWIVLLCDVIEEASDFRRSYQKLFGDGEEVQLEVIVKPFSKSAQHLRIVEIANYLKSPTCPIKNDRDIIIYLNPRGVLMMGDGMGTGTGTGTGAKIGEWFGAANKDLLFGAIPFAHGLFPETAQFFESQYPKEVYRFLFSGFAIGYKWSMAQFYGSMASKVAYYPRSAVTGGELTENHLVGNTYYQALSPKFDLSNKAIKHIRVGLDHPQRFFFIKGPKMPLHEILRCNAPFLFFFGSHSGPGQGDVIPHQRLDYTLVAKLTGAGGS